MKKLSNTIEALVFASGDPVPVKYIVEKLGVSAKEVNAAIDELKLKYDDESGIMLQVFDGKLRFASSPKYKDEISAVITPIVEKEFTKTILECSALIAYKQPVTRSELEDIRGTSCDYAIHTLLDLEMIEPCGRRDTIGKPIEYRTTPKFLVRFGLNSIEDLPDYDELMAQIAETNSNLAPAEDSTYLYRKDEYVEGEDEGDAKSSRKSGKRKQKDDDIGKADSDVPEFLSNEEIVIKID
ncbi:MAG: SMC-Scp complex subunit ScpB [Clostridia bacterium]|nr:SMC-Scp complex subunit ScpB [Clostridia bacterium]